MQCGKKQLQIGNKKILQSVEIESFWIGKKESKKLNWFKVPEIYHIRERILPLFTLNIELN